MKNYNTEDLKLLEELGVPYIHITSIDNKNANIKFVDGRHPELNFEFKNTKINKS